MKYCIACKYLYFVEKKIGQGSPQTGSWTIEDGSLYCQKGHWEKYLAEGPVKHDVELAMETAETCLDFKEREW